MGEVYRAEDLKLGQPVALKFVRSHLASSARQRLIDEVRLGRQVSHPNVCRLYDIVEVDDLTFIAMEYVDGEDLASLLSRIGHLPPDKAVDLARDLCAGLQAAHDRGVLHRDLKPANVMVDGRGRARLTDFGLAVEQEGAPHDTAGTALYMAPEQLAGGAVTAKSDLYALGLILYEMIVGQRFFNARTLDELRSQHRAERLSRLGVLSSQVDAALHRAIAQCLEEDPQARPASAHAVLTLLPGGDALEAAIAAGQTPAPDVVAAAGSRGDLGAAAAWGGLIAFLAVPVFIATQPDWLPTAPPPKAPAVLVERARSVASRLAPEVSAVDWKGYFEWDQRRIGQITRRDQSPDRFDRMRDSTLSALRFVYRQSPETLVASNRHGIVNGDDPPGDLPGMVEVVLDPQGRLLRYLAVPPRVETGGPWPDPDWTALFRESQLEPGSFRSVSPEWTASVDSDHKAAWEGLYPGMSETTFRIEAAAYHGRPVWFALLPPWSAPDPDATPRRAHSAPMVPAVQVLLAVVLPLGAVVLVRRNLRLKRGDRRGSLRVALFVFTAYGLARLVRADHVAEFDSEFWLLVKVFAYPMVFAALVWTLYMALEPYARRQWPRVLISWGRLLAGRWRDPMVGRDVLIGAFGSAFVFGLRFLWDILQGEFYRERPPQPAWGWVAPEFLTSWSQTGYQVFVNLHSAVLYSIIWLFVLVLLRVLLRRDGLALVAWAVLLARQEWSYGGVEGAIGLLIDAVIVSLLALSNVLVLTRGGLLGFATMLLVTFVGAGVPLTFDASLWWAPRGWVILGVLTALGIYGFRTSLGGKPLFGRDWLET